MNIIEVNDLSLPELAPYQCTNEKQLFHWNEPEIGIFIAESPKVIRRALDAGYQPISLLCEKKYVTGQASDIIDRCQADVYTADSEVLKAITGYQMTQGVLCAMYRQKPSDLSGVLANAERVAVLEDIMNQTNVGAIFRSAAALGMDAVILTPSCSDPLYRRSVRVSMGTVFQIPWTYFPCGAPDYVELLKASGFFTVAMALRNDTINIDAPELSQQKKLAVILGTEGEGLKPETIQACDATVKIPMMHGVDSLNVASASAVAFWELRKR
ncbi:MAG TPA: rRNA methyltransferase [Ruminococcus sp.]|nr:rRNA methyltransferase [Ruminococcus sp.]